MCSPEYRDFFQSSMSSMVSFDTNAILAGNSNSAMATMEDPGSFADIFPVMCGSPTCRAYLTQQYQTQVQMEQSMCNFAPNLPSCGMSAQQQADLPEKQIACTCDLAPLMTAAMSPTAANNHGMDPNAEASPEDMMQAMMGVNAVAFCASDSCQAATMLPPAQIQSECAQVPAPGTGCISDCNTLTFTANVAGDDPSAFDTATYKTTLARFLGSAITEAMISVTVTLGSLVVTSEIAANSTDDALSAAVNLDALSDPAHASTVLNVTVTSTSTDSPAYTTSALYQATYDLAEKLGIPIWALALIVVGCTLLVGCCLGIIVVKVCCQTNKPQGSMGHGVAKGVTMAKHDRA
jgi:hypothetical protein